MEIKFQALFFLQYSQKHLPFCCMLFLNVIFIIAENSVEPIFYTLLNLFPMFDLFYSFKYFSFILNIKVMINIFVTSFDGLEF